MIEPLSVALSLATLRPIFSEIAKNINKFLSNEFLKHYQLKNFSINNTQLIDTIEKIGLVKTLYTGAESPVEISSFFYSPSITTKDGITKINSLNELSTTHSVLIEATVGQGKSILMRYLALQEAAKNSRIPIFIELKNISKDKNLFFLIREKITAWTKNITDEQINFILQSGNVSLFLDAFDEISKDYVADTLSSIENLANNYTKLKLVVSSRPEHEIKFSNFFETVQVNPYDHEDQKNLINILVQDRDAQTTLINSIENSTPEIQKLLTTPLMIGLYVKKFNADFSPPENITSFYKNIFEVVAITHDRTKGGYSRKSASNLQQDRLEIIFERFCFECYKKDKTSFEKIEIINLLDSTLTRLNIEKCSGQQILEDFCSYLCLIVRDGLNYTFIHRSIFEYYVALFFSKLNNTNAEKAIHKISEYNILVFLKNLNKYYFNLYFLKNELNFFIIEFNNEIYSYKLKQNIPDKFLNLFFTEDGKYISINSSIFNKIKSHNYLFQEYIRP
ncbi:NACHT domain-containing protein, partial [Acinetobacter baumannii]|nr:NACHT domain-containing protein [Acinetobacter baumannii]